MKKLRLWSAFLWIVGHALWVGFAAIFVVRCHDDIAVFSITLSATLLALYYVAIGME